ncbi:MAG: exodeoxyribonuclease VII small subunit [Treponema sp.]|nr:exodeoxyribonuclease VII small subunit [Treponema sp.]
MEKNQNEVKTTQNFEEKLQELEKLTADIKRSDISLEDALKDFEEGIKLAAGMEKELDKIEGKIQILMTEPQPMAKENPPQFDLFSDDGEVNGTRK